MKLKYKERKNNLMKDSDDYIRLEEAKRICLEIDKYIFPNGKGITMRGFSSEWKGYPSKSQVIHFLALMRRTELKNDGLFFPKLYFSLENICDALINKGITQAEGIKSDIKILLEVESDNLDLHFPFQYIVNGETLDPKEVIDNQLYGDFFHSTIERIRTRKANKASEDIAVFMALNKYRGYHLQLENIAKFYDRLLPLIESASDKINHP